MSANRRAPNLVQVWLSDALDEKLARLVLVDDGLTKSSVLRRLIREADEPQPRPPARPNPRTKGAALPA